jgi:hypothetical protein
MLVLAVVVAASRSTTRSTCSSFITINSAWHGACECGTCRGSTPRIPMPGCSDHGIVTVLRRPVFRLERAGLFTRFSGLGFGRSCLIRKTCSLGVCYRRASPDWALAGRLCDSDASSSFQIGVAGLFTRFSGLGFGRSSLVRKTCSLGVCYRRAFPDWVLDGRRVAGLFTRFSALTGVCCAT